MPGVAVPASLQSLDGWQDVDYRDLRELSSVPQPQPSQPLLAIPYLAWANRGAGAMRVWIPDAV